jgi:hypothetical protein
MQKTETCERSKLAIINNIEIFRIEKKSPVQQCWQCSVSMCYEKSLFKNHEFNEITRKTTLQCQLSKNQRRATNLKPEKQTPRRSWMTCIFQKGATEPGQGLNLR